MNLGGLDFDGIQRLLRQRKITCRQVTEQFLENINEGRKLNAFISILSERARAKADDVDQKLRKNCAGTLAGLVIAIKDNINIAGEITTCGSKMLAHFVSPYDATVIQRLDAADAIIIGKTNMDEFAMGSSNETSYYGAAKNPHNFTCVPGGSSGGSAVAVAARMAMAALGSDTGGSVRQPASFCGVVGLKPGYGLVSRFGLVAYASSFDQIGPITSSIADCAKILEVIAGHDPMDSTSADFPVPQYFDSMQRPKHSLKIGLPVEYLGEGLNPEVRHTIARSVELLKKAGAAIVPVHLQHTEYALSCYYILATAEASSNLARYDGAHFGFRCSNPSDLDQMYSNTRTDGFGDEVKRRILLGTYVLSAGYYDAYYRNAQKVRTLIQQDFRDAFEQCDCIITPTTATTAFSIGEKINDPLTMYLSDLYTVSANLAGIPALSLPCGFDSSNLPIGIQIMANRFDEATLFNVGSLLERLLRDVN